MELAPSPTAKVAHASLGAACAALGVGLWAEDGLLTAAIGLPLAAGLVCLGVGVALRCARLGVECRNGTVRVRGLLLTRTVPRGNIDGISSFPALRWRDGADRRRWTPMVFFMSNPGGLDRHRRHVEESVRQLRRWVGRDA